MTEMKCNNCNTSITLRKRHTLKIECDCNSRNIKVSTKTPKTWTDG